jgi:peptide/nickel transport system substrate-binding protein
VLPIAKIINFVLYNAQLMNHFKLSFLFLICISFFSCKTEKTDGENVIHIRLKKDPERINPLIFPNPTAREIFQYIHLPMADYDPNSLVLTPILIKQIPTEMAIDTGNFKGGIAFDIEMDDFAKWDNGTPITAEDYVFTLKAINLPLTNSGKYRDLTKNISAVEVDQSNPKRFRVIFAKDYMLALETAINIEVYPRYFYDSLNVLSSYKLSDFIDENEAKLKADSVLVRFAETFNGNVFSREKISGSGPYKFVSWTADQNIVLEKKSNYWGIGKNVAQLQQNPDKMIFHIIPDELTAISQLKAGAIDLINEVSGDNYESLQADNELKDFFSFYHPALTKQYLISMNNQDPLLSDVKVRKAIAHLVDVDNIINAIEKGKGSRTVAPIHPLKKTHNKDLTPVPFDIEKAKTLLMEAGWKDNDNNGILDKEISGDSKDLKFEILVSGLELGKKIAILLKENASKVGMDIEITEKDFKVIRAEYIKNRKFQLVPTVISQDLQMWDDMSKWHSDNDSPEGSNDMSYRNATTDGLIDDILATKDDAQRIELYKKIQQQIYDDQPVVFLYAPEERIIVSKKWASTATVKRPGYLANTFKYVGAGIAKAK